jgi:hypothetical protein
MKGGIGMNTGEVVKAAKVIERKIKWAREVAKNPDGFKDAASGKVYTPLEFLDYVKFMETENAAILAEARAIRKRSVGMRKIKIDAELADRLDALAAKDGVTRDEAAEKCLRLAFADPAALQRGMTERAKTRAA